MVRKTDFLPVVPLRGYHTLIIVRVFARVFVARGIFVHLYSVQKIFSKIPYEIEML